MSLPPAGYFCLQRQKYPKTPLETTFQDFLGALCPAANLSYFPRTIALPVCRCPSKGLCHHSFPLSLRCRCLLPRQPLPPLPPYRGIPHPTQPPSLELSFRASPQTGVGIRPPKAPSGGFEQYLRRNAPHLPQPPQERRLGRDLIIAHPTGREFPKGEGAHALSLWTLQGDGIFKGGGKFGIPLSLNGVFGYFCRC